MNAPVELPNEGREGELWRELLELAHLRGDGWTLIGALMVSLHALRAGMLMPRATHDIDAVVEVRGVAHEPQSFAADLTDLGWDIPEDAIGNHGIGHRFHKGELRFDLLVPEGLGERADLTTLPPLVTVPIDGATQALHRTEPVAVRYGDQTGQLPCPDVLGAIVIKSCAAVAREQDPDKRPERHLDDLAILYAAVSDPRAASRSCDKKDRQRIRRAGEPNWSLLPPDQSADAQAARAIILGS